ncbi:MAG: UbiA family prenyltransferase [Alphaproteobacteria bacterium]
MKNLITMLRPHHWVKNLLVFTILVAAKQAFNIELLWQNIIVFFLFCLSASSGYIINDVLDKKNDMRHPSKKFRPIASGKVSISIAFITTFILLLLMACLSLVFFSPMVLYLLFGYFLLAVFYSLYLKKLPILDLMMLSLFYFWRVWVGSESANIPLSFWLIIFTLFLFFSLSCLKRYVELQKSKTNREYKNIGGRGYLPNDDIFVMLIGIASSFAALVVLSLYFHEINYYFSYIYIIILFLWLMRLWLLSYRNIMYDDPLVFAIKDKWSLILFFFAGVFIIIDTLLI